MAAYRQSLNTQIADHARSEMKMYQELKFVIDEICVCRLPGQ